MSAGLLGWAGGLLAAGHEGLLPYFPLLLFGIRAALLGWGQRYRSRVRRGFGQPFRRVDIEPDGLFAAGRRVSVRLSDGRWLRTRFLPGNIVVLARERHLWLLGDGDHLFAQPPGSPGMKRARIHDGPLPGAERVEVVSWEPTPPRLDPVRIAARSAPRAAGWKALFYLVPGLFGVVAAVTFRGNAQVFPAWAALTVTGLAGAALVVWACALFAASRRKGPPPTGDEWVELAVTIDPTRRLRRHLTGSALLPDGSRARFRLRADGSLVMNVLVTGRLWLTAEPRVGATTIAGLPGYPCGGSFRLLPEAPETAL